MSDQTLKVKLEGDATGLQDATRKASSAVQTLEKTVEKNSDSLNKNIKEAGNIAQSSAGKVKGAAKETEHSVEELAKAVKDSMDKSSASARKGAETTTGALAKIAGKAAALGGYFQKVGKLAWDGLKALYSHLVDIGDASQKLGTTAEHFQALQQAAKTAGDEMSDVEDVFKSIQKAAKDALSGDSGAVAQLAAVGVTVDQLKGRRPEQIFDIIAAAVDRMGNSAAEQKAKIDLCGESINALNGGLSSYSNLPKGGLFTDDSVKAAERLQKTMEDLNKALLSLANNAGVLKILEMGAKQLGEAAEEVKAITAPTQIQGKTWNEVNVSEENRRKAAEYDRKYQEEKAREAALSTQLYGAPVGTFYATSYAPLPKNKNGLTPGQQKFAYDPITNPEGFQPVGTPSKATQEELEEAKRKIDEKKRAAARAEKVKQNAALLQELRQLPNADQLKEQIDDYAKELDETLDGGELSRDFEKEIRGKDASITERKKIEEQDRRIWEATASPKEKALRKIQEEITREREAAGENPDQLDKVDRMEILKWQEWVKDYGAPMDYKRFRALVQMRQKESKERRKNSDGSSQEASPAESGGTPATNDATPKPPRREHEKTGGLQKIPDFSSKAAAPGLSIEGIGKKLDQIATAVKALEKNVYVVK